MALTVVQWQAEFQKMVLQKKWNVFPPALIKQMLLPEADPAAFVSKAKALIRPYESEVVTVSGLTGQNEPLSPRWLYLELLKIDTTPAIFEVMTEASTPVLAENGDYLELEEASQIEA